MTGRASNESRGGEGAEYSVSSTTEPEDGNAISEVIGTERGRNRELKEKPLLSVDGQLLGLLFVVLSSPFRVTIKPRVVIVTVGEGAFAAALVLSRASRGT